MINHTHCLAEWIPLKSLMVSRAFEHSKISQIGLALGPSKDKKCSTVTKCLKELKETIQLSSILARLKCRCHQPSSPRYSNNGTKLCQMFSHISRVRKAKHSAPATCHVRISRKRYHPSALSSPEQRSYCHHRPTFIRLVTASATSFYLSANLAEKTKISTSWALPSYNTSTPPSTSTITTLC